MGVFFGDPDVNIDDILWYSWLSYEMKVATRNSEELISIDEELETYSCYAELHRKVAIFSCYLCINYAA